MDNIAGPPVTGRNFVGRKADIDALVETLKNHDILLLGPRRIGKTSVSRAVMAWVIANGWRAIEINVASATDEKGFLDKLETALRKELGGAIWASIKEGFEAFATSIKSIKLSGPGDVAAGIELNNGAAKDWTVVANEALVLMGKLDKPWLIYIDELPIFLFNLIKADPATGVQRVRRFLDWFRNDVRGLADAKQIRWLVTGSVGLDTLVQQHGMADTINSLKHVTLPPFTQAEAEDLVRSLATSYKMVLSDAHVLLLLTTVQWLQPYYVQFVFNELRALHAAEKTADMADLIERAVASLAKPGNDNDFHHWEERLSLQLTPSQAGDAVALLTLAAATQAGTRAEALLAALHERMGDVTDDAARMRFIVLRDILLRDAYLIADDTDGVRRYRFQLEPLRRWWARRQAL